MYDRTRAIIDVMIAAITAIENPDVNSDTLNNEKLFPGDPDASEKIAANKAVPTPKPK